MKKIISVVLLLCFLLIVVACSGGNDAPIGGTGRYVESNITPPISGEFISLQTNEGAIVAFDNGLRTRFDSVDGGATWAQRQGPGYNTNHFADVNTATFLPDGRLLAHIPGEGLAIISEDGSHEHFPLEEIDNAVSSGGNVNVNLLQVLDNNQLLLSYNTSAFPFLGGGLNIDSLDGLIGDVSAFVESGAMGDMSAIFDSIDINAVIGDVASIISGDTGNVGGHGGQGGQTVPFAVPPGGGATGGRGFGGGGIMNLFGGGQTMSTHDLTTGELIETLTSINAVSANQTGDFHSIQDGAIMRLSANGDVDNLLDGTAFAFTAMGETVSSILTLDDGSIIVNITNQNNGQSRLFRYAWDANASINPDKILTVWSLTDNATVRATIGELWRNNPDAYIVHEIALGDGAMSASDAIRTLNTRLLSGSGPDILILDGTPIESYVGRGMLLDMSGNVNASDIPANLLAPFTAQTAGRLYVVPTQFKLPVIMGNERDLQAVTTLDSLVDRVVSGNPATSAMGRRGGFSTVPEEERSALSFSNLEELFDIMWLTSSSAIINNNQLDSNALQEFFESMEAISNKYNLTEAQQGFPMGNVFVSADAGGRGAMPNITGSLVQYMMQTTHFAAFPIDHLMTMQVSLDRANSDIALFPGLSQGSWQPSTIVGISADTNVPAFAKEFVNTMLSLEVQSINHGEGLPITERGLTQQVDNLNEQLANLDMYIDASAFNIIGQLRTPSFLEITLREMIWTTTERLCTGRLDIEGAVREVEQNIRNYLAERS